MIQLNNMDWLTVLIAVFTVSRLLAILKNEKLPTLKKKKDVCNFMSEVILFDSMSEGALIHSGLLDCGQWM